MVTVKDRKGGHRLLRLHRNRIGRNDTGDHFDSRRFSRPVRPKKPKISPVFALKERLSTAFPADRPYVFETFRIVSIFLPSLKCNSRTKFQLWRLLHSCAERAHIIPKFAQSKLDVFFSRALSVAENKPSLKCNS